MKTVAIIQARMGSTRLPGKSLMKIKGKPIIQHVVERTMRSNVVDKVIVATSSSNKDKPLINFLKENDIEYFRGDEKNVLDRYYHAAKKFNADIIIRICGDQPLIDPNSVDKTFLSRKENHFTYSKHEKGWPDGTGCEVIPFSSLKLAHETSKDSFEREHIQPFFLRRKNELKIKKVNAPKELSSYKVHLAIDTVEDFKRVSFLINSFEEEFIELKDLLEKSFILNLQKK